MFHKIIFLRYEDIAEQPWRAVADVASAVGLPPPGALVETTASSFSRRTLEAFDYGIHFKCEQISQVCKLLDQGAMYLLGYRGCQRRRLQGSGDKATPAATALEAPCASSTSAAAPQLGAQKAAKKVAGTNKTAAIVGSKTSATAPKVVATHKKVN